MEIETPVLIGSTQLSHRPQTFLPSACVAAVAQSGQRVKEHLRSAKATLDEMAAMSKSHASRIDAAARATNLGTLHWASVAYRWKPPPSCSWMPKVKAGRKTA
jgi:hypothetical protein